ncbi:GNAT family N-acetyltransferase [Brevundimonas sp. Root1423]|uniref:GNAT family N-acetyltransferase n=1 Tax=Brevundimonas sp. Root1423 TaxID=1736462 RepID=UPI0006F228E8|nr:GNAT family N-acetyltransferase [Brevundimonas sp. Root1423]KQY89676.1 GNAT family acetyltransferase [Brevundimonas sp. Root1423]
MSLAHPLDRPVWSALNTRVAPLAIRREQDGGAAVRLDPDVGVFVAAADGSPASRALLTALSREYPGAGMVEPEGAPIEAVLPDVPVISRASCVQMTAAALTAGPAGDIEFQTLGEADADEMLALAILTRPGPFRRGTLRLGGFIGVRREGRLIAMAGERMKVEGYSELSGVCTHPDFRGQGLAGALSRAVVAGILARGEQAFLHAYAEHTATVAFYESLGFAVRTRMTYTVLA